MKTPTAAAPAGIATVPTVCSATGVNTLNTLSDSAEKFVGPPVKSTPRAKIASMMTSRMSAIPSSRAESFTSR